MKRILLAACIIFTVSGLFAQEKPADVDILVGPKIKLKKDERVDEIIGNDDEGFFVASVSGYKLKVSYFLNDLTLSRTFESSLKEGKLARSYSGFIQLGDEYFLITKARNKKTKTSTVYHQTLNKNTLELSAPKVVSEENFGGKRGKKSASYSFRASADSSYWLVIVDHPFEKEGNEKFGLHVYDKDLNIVWRKKMTELPDLDSEFGRYGTVMGNDGQVYILGNVLESTTGKGLRKERIYRFDMLVYSDDSEEPERFEIKPDQNYLSDLTFKITNTGHIQLVGFYSADGKGQNGVFNMLISLDDYSVELESYTEFPTDFIVQHSSEKAKKKAKKKEAKGKEVVFYSYDIDDLILNNDGSITMIGEQYRYYTTSSTDANGNTTYTHHYVYGNIIVVQFDPLGDVAWMELIPKFQHTTNDGGFYSGYALVNLGDGDLKFVFNDSPKNSYYESSGKFYAWKRKAKTTEIVMYEVSHEGEHKRYTLVKAGEEEIMTVPHISFQTKDGELIILNYMKKLTKFAKVKF